MPSIINGGDANSSTTTSFTRFHVLVLFLWQFVNFFSAQMLFGIFANFTPRWRCQAAINFNSTRTIPIVQFDGEFGKDCSVYAECPEERLEFEPMPFGSAAFEFDWICGTRAYMRALFSQVQFGGILLGTVLLSPLSDRFGRKPVGLATFALAIFTLAFSALSTTTGTLLLGRFLLCFLIGAAKVVLVTFAMEIIAPRHRIYLRTFCNWGISRLLLTSLCFLFPDWRSASIAIACACLPALLILAFALPESPTWLHSKGRIEEMRRSEKWMARVAGIPYAPVEHVELATKRANLCTIVRDRELFGRLLVLWSMWFCSALSIYSVDLNSSRLSGDLFANQWLLSCPIIASKLVLLIVDSNWPAFSRRLLHVGSQSIVCLSFAILLALDLFHYNGILVLFGNFIGITFLEYTWDANYLSAVESMPTQMRASSLGSCSMVARFGAFFSPVFVFLNELWGASAYLAVVSLGTANLAVSYLWLPETKGIDLDAVQIGLEEKNGQLAEEEEEKETKKFLPAGVVI